MPVGDVEAAVQQDGDQAQRGDGRDVVDVRLARLRHQQHGQHGHGRDDPEQAGEVGLRVLQVVVDVELDHEPADQRECERSCDRALRARKRLGHGGSGCDGFLHLLGDERVVAQAPQQRGGGQDERRQQHDAAPAWEQRTGQRRKQRINEVRDGDQGKREPRPVAGEHFHPAEDGQRPAHARRHLHGDKRDIVCVARRNEHGVDRADDDGRDEQRLRPVDAPEVGEDGDDEEREAVGREAYQGVGGWAVGSRVEVEQPRALQQAEPERGHRREGEDSRFVGCVRVHRFPFACETVAPHYNAPAPAALCEAEQKRTDVSRETLAARTAAIMRPCRTLKRTNVSRETFGLRKKRARRFRAHCKLRFLDRALPRRSARCGARAQIRRARLGRWARYPLTTRGRAMSWGSQGTVSTRCSSKAMPITTASARKRGSSWS